MKVVARSMEKDSVAEGEKLFTDLLLKLPGVWAEDDPPGLAENQAPVIVELL